ncbi:MAG: hypothetical protein ACKVWV_15490 [Planctomycetota bacterium]
MPADVAAIIGGYVARHEQWKGLAYRIESRGTEGGLDVYSVVDLTEERRLSEHHEELSPGGGTSFVVFYDARVREVVRHRHFQ